MLPDISSTRLTLSPSALVLVAVVSIVPDEGAFCTHVALVDVVTVISMPPEYTPLPSASTLALGVDVITIVEPVVGGIVTSAASVQPSTATSLSAIKVRP